MNRLLMALLYVWFLLLGVVLQKYVFNPEQEVQASFIHLGNERLTAESQPGSPCVTAIRIEESAIARVLTPECPYVYTDDRGVLATPKGRINQ